MEMEAQNNIGIASEAGINDSKLEEISLNLEETQMDPKEIRVEQRKIQRYICALWGAAWIMSIHMVIMLIEMMRYVISGIGPDGTSKIPEESTLIILIPLVIIFLVLVIYLPEQNQNEMLNSTSPDCVGTMITVYYSEVLMLFTWLFIFYVKPAGRTNGLLIILIDMIVGFYFICRCYAGGNVLMFREKQLFESIQSRLEMRNISKEESS